MWNAAVFYTASNLQGLRGHSGRHHIGTRPDIAQRGKDLERLGQRSHAADHAPWQQAPLVV